MKKLSASQKLYGQCRAAKLARRKSAWKHWRKKQRRMIHADAILAKYGNRPRYISTVRGRVTLELPVDLSLERNYDEVLEFIGKLRRLGVLQRQRLYVDFRQVRHVNPAAALVLAAELDRWRQISTRVLHILDTQQWDPDVFRLLEEMGLYDLLSVSNRPIAKSSTAQRFIRFRSSKLVLGGLAVVLRDDLQAVLGDKGFARSRLLYEALVEAMSNSRRHAYPEDFPMDLTPHIGLWWMSGAYDATNKSLTVMFYDQGIGIPATIPRKGRIQRLRGWLSEMGLPDDDAARIKASIELGATQTDEPYRGLGMRRNILRYIEGHPRDRLRILSAKGEYLYYGDGRDEFRSHTQSLGGTLIQWELFAEEGEKIDGQQDN